MKIEDVGQKFGLSSFHGVPRGNVLGFEYSVVQVNIDFMVKMYFISFVFNKKLNKEERKAISKAQGVPVMRVESIGLDENAVLLPLKYGFKKLEKHQAHLEKLATCFNELGLKNLNHCIFCGNEELDTYRIIKGVPVGVHKSCVDGYVEQVETHIENISKTVKNLPKSIILAIIGAFIGLIPTIISLSFFGYYFGLLYALIPLASFYGYKMGKGPRASYVPIIITVISVIIAPLYIVFIYSSWASIEQITLSSLLANPENMSSFLSDLGTSILFIAIGIYISWKKIYSQTHAQVKKDINQLKSNQ